MNRSALYGTKSGRDRRDAEVHVGLGEMSRSVLTSKRNHVSKPVSRCLMTLNGELVFPMCSSYTARDALHRADSCSVTDVCAV